MSSIQPANFSDLSSSYLPPFSLTSSQETMPPPLPQRFAPIDYHEVFRQTLHTHIYQTEKLEKSCQFKLTLMKVLFVSLLVLGVVCASSFLLLPGLNAIATFLGLSVAVTTMVWEATFISGSLLAGLSFVPKRFVKGFEEDVNKYHQKASVLKQLEEQGNFIQFLQRELAGKRSPEMVASSSDFAELYYLLNETEAMQENLLRHRQELIETKNLIQPNHVLLEREDIKLQKKLEKSLDKATQLLEKEEQEFVEKQNKIRVLRLALIELDRKHSLIYPQ